MKEFGKSLFAKTLYYLLNIVSFVVFIASIITEVLIAEMGFYEMSAENVFGKYYVPAGEDLVWARSRYEYAWNLTQIASQMRYWIYLITLVSFVIAVVFLVKYLNVAGRRRGDNDLHLLVFDKVPTDLYLIWLVMIYGCGIAVAGELSYDYSYYLNHSSGFVSPVALTLGTILIVAGVLYLPIVLRGFAVRIKAKTFFSNTLIWYIIKLLWKPFRLMGEGLKNIQIIWRTLIVYILIAAIELLVLVCAFYESDIIVVCWAVEKFLLLPIILYMAITLRKLEGAGEKLAAGDLKYKLNTKGLHWLFRKHGENLNSISDGMAQAVEKEIKSDRMKTELITNVSHDIKTPLTSIINYATLISDEPCDNEKINEYSEVLVRQSDRLKRLIEDLVEASKASTGNIEVELVPCDPSVFVTQADGEYEQKLAAANLSIITKLPEEEVKIMADGRRMWRVFDNLMNNICKYALPGTRVYLSLDIVDSEAVFTFKNTSRDQLDISEEELMERFVRGDQSRNTDGNGLGLSIAKSMAEVQGGKLDISIDGDLFKATASFPVIE